MVSTLLAGLSLAATVSLVVAVVILGIQARRKTRAVEKVIRSFITAPDEKTPSQLAVMVDQICQLAARAVIMQAKATFMGEASAISKAANKEAQSALEARMPWLSMIAAIAPGFSKSLMKNPALLNLGAQVMQGAPRQPAESNHREETQSSMNIT